MAQYSFQERFCPFVLDGSKPHTLRNRRKYPAKVGDVLHLFFGLRTKWCKRLRTEACIKTHSVSISKRYGIILYSEFFTEDQMKIARVNPVDKRLPGIWRILDENTRDLFAWRDGFRPDGSTLENPTGAYNLMFRYWKQNNQLTWVGDAIYWLHV